MLHLYQVNYENKPSLAHLPHVEELDIRGISLELFLEQSLVELEVPVVEPEAASAVYLYPPWLIGRFNGSLVS